MNPQTLTPMAFGALFVHPPLLHEDKKLRDLFTNLGAIHGFTEYQQPTEGTAQFHRVWRGTNQRLSCTIIGDRIEITHAFPSTNMNEFWRTVEDILKNSAEALHVPVFVLQQYLIRKTALPKAEADARSFLAQRVCSIDNEKLKALGRPYHGIGLRFVFAPSQETPFDFDVKIESLLSNPSQLYLENLAKFYVPVQPNDLSPIKRNLEVAESFLTETVVGFLSQFNPGSK